MKIDMPIGLRLGLIGITMLVVVTLFEVTVGAITIEREPMDMTARPLPAVVN